VIRGARLRVLTGGVKLSPAPTELVDNLLEAQVTRNSGQRSGFQLRFALGKSTVLERELLPGRSLDPPARVVLVLQLDGQAHVLSDGVITRHDISRGNESGQSTLTVTGVDLSQLLDLLDLPGLPFPMPAEAQVATLLATLAPFGVIPIVIPGVIIVVPNPVDKWPSLQGTPYSHITRLADEAGYIFDVSPGPKPGMNLAYWGPEYAVGKPQPALTVNSDAATNVESMSFSFDGISKRLHLLWLFIKQIKVPIPIPIPDISPLSPPLGKKYPIPLGNRFLNASPDFSTKSDSKDKDAPSKLQIGQALLRGLARATQASYVVSASGSLDVLRYGRLLEARKLVGVRGAGRAYDGTYLVRSVTTTAKPGEVKQRFTLVRNALVSHSERVAT
jgi:hypothetical protein